MSLNHHADAASLLDRAIELGLRVKDDAAEHQRQIRMALSTLGASD